MGSNKYNSQAVTYNNIKYDSRTELLFHQTYPNLVRNEQSFTLWESGDGADTITYTPDFYDPIRNIYIEIKGSYFGFAEPEFTLRWKLAKDYFGKRALICLIPFNGEWLYPEMVKEAKKGLKMENTASLNEIIRLLKRKKLSNEEKDTLIALITDPKAAWVTSRNKAIVNKRKPIMEIRHKLNTLKKNKYDILEKFS